VLLWFVMLILGGAGPPPEVLSDPMRLAAKATPLPHVITLIQDPWLGFGWSVVSTAVVLAFLGGSALVAWRFLRWD
jgi:ABC-2 type transport system permease protein